MEITFIIFATLIIILYINSGYRKILNLLERLEDDVHFLREKFREMELQNRPKREAENLLADEKKEREKGINRSKDVKTEEDYQSAARDQINQEDEKDRNILPPVEVLSGITPDPEMEFSVVELKGGKAIESPEKGMMIEEPPVEKFLRKGTLPIESEQPKEKNDYEKLVGENFLSKIGIATLVLGIGYFVKYAIDQNWINEIGRVILGILCGGILIAIAHRLKDRYRTFSSILVGGGISIWYITITIAFQDYKIFSQTVSFLFLILITLFSVFLSIRYDRKELAIFSLLGGFASPLMVSSGMSNYLVLFSYIFILNTGMLIVAFRKDWKIIGIIAGVLTQFFYWSWLFLSFDKQYAGAICFILLFYIQFYLLALIDHYRSDKKIQAFHSILILTDNLLLYAAALYIFSAYPVNVKGVITIGMAVLNAIPLAILFRDKTIDKRLIYLLIALVLTFISLAVPIQLNGCAITLFWAFETVILLGLWQKSKIPVFKSGFILIEVLVLFSLLANWFHYFEFQGNREFYLPIVFNKWCITGLTIAATVWLNAYLIRKENDEEFLPFIPHPDRLFYFSGLILLFVTLFLELQYQMNVFFRSQNFRWLSYGLYAYLFVSVVAWVRRDRKNWFRLLYNLLLVLILSYVFLYLPIILRVRQEVLSGTLNHWRYFLLHYFSFPCLIYCMVFVLQKKEEGIRTFKKRNLIYWLTAFVWIVVLSAEFDHLLLMLFYNGSNKVNILNISHNIVYPVLWGITSFIFMIIGMKQKNRILRIISLSLFVLIIAKLYLYDIWKMGQTGRIISLVFLGILFLVVSFLYQKLKILLQKEDENKDSFKP
ncbi:MAG: DUF2339 domain-containing protein [Candidatus Azobacteroides sp.]|nr:DUF2339 domain-containing protein [Candidatus Azobacteroides sp.]